MSGFRVYEVLPSGGSGAFSVLVRCWVSVGYVIQCRARDGLASWAFADDWFTELVIVERVVKFSTITCKKCFKKKIGDCVG